MPVGIFAGNEAVEEIFLAQMDLGDVVDHFSWLLADSWFEGALLQLFSFKSCLFVVKLSFFDELLPLLLNLPLFREDNTASALLRHPLGLVTDLWLES